MTLNTSSPPTAPAALAGNSRSPSSFADSSMDQSATTLAESLRLSEQRYRSLVEATSSIVWNTPASGDFESPQPGWSAFTGQSYEELKGRGWLSALHPDDRAHTFRVWSHAVENRVVYKVEHRLRRHDGQYRYMSVRAVPILDNDGNLIEWVGIHTDITDRKRAEEGSRFLAEASAVLGSSLDYQNTLESIAKLAVPQMADWCAFDLAGPNGTIRRIAVHHSDPAKVGLARELEQRYPPRPDDSHGVPHVLRTGQAELLPDIPDSLIDSTTHDAEHAHVIRTLGLKSAMFVPLIARGRVLGALTLVTAESGRRYDATDLELAGDLGRRVAVAVDSANLYRESREAVRAREEISALLDTLLEKAPVGFAFFNNDLRFLRVNEELARINGVPPHEHWGRRVSEVLPGMPASVEQTLQQVRDSGEPVLNAEVNGATRAHGGEPRDLLVSFYPVRTAANRSLGIGAVVVDITDRKAAEEALRESESRLRMAMEAGRMGSWEWNIASGRVIWSPGLERIHGLEPGTFSGTFDAYESTIHPDDREHVLAQVNATVDERREHHLEYRIVRPDGQVRWLEARGKLVYARAGEQQRLVGVCTDISDRKWAEETLRQSRDELERLVDARTAALQVAASELRAANTRLEQSNRELQDFASVASHDLQEPLRKIQAFGDRLAIKVGPTLSDEGRDYLRRMQNAAGRMQRLINDLLAFSRVTTKAQPFLPADLNEVATEVVGDLETAIERTGGNVQTGQLPTLDADATQMRQLFQNLIANALKFHRAGVPPVVRVWAERSGDGERCTIFVADNGIGFDEKYLDRIFNVFQRLHGRGTYEGTGIGLAVCRKIAERHGGSITARSRPGEGSTFIITLPVHHERIEETRG